MDELLRLLRENNEMLKYLCAYINKVGSEKYQTSLDLKALMTNLVSDLYTNNLQNRVK